MTDSDSVETAHCCTVHTKEYVYVVSAADSISFFYMGVALYWDNYLIFYNILYVLLLLLLLLQIKGRTIVYSAVLPSPGLKLATSPLALANQQLFC